MPHTARKMSESGYYHVVPKGIADQLLFADDEDREKYLGLLSQVKKRYNMRVHAYCLMSNHVHLVIEDVDDHLSEAIKFLHERYAMYYSDKVGRTGGVFRKPCWSEPIEDELRLLCAVRYVHNNPFAAGICRASQYRWSSVGSYLGMNDNGVADTELVLSLLDGRRGFIEFSQTKCATAHPFEGSSLRQHLSDEESERIATGILGHDPRCGSTLDDVRILKERGFLQRQIMRMTGIGKNVVYNA